MTRCGSTDVKYNENRLHWRRKHVVWTEHVLRKNSRVAPSHWSTPIPRACADERACAVAQQEIARLSIEHTIDRRTALAGAGFVLNATAIDRNRLWKLDYEIPKKHGIRQTLGENGGPGGLFFTLRTLPMVLDFARDMEELCPDALLINFSNPESRIILALGKYSHIRALGLCEGIFGGRNYVAHIMDLPAAEVDVWGAGLNHFQWLTQICHRETGVDPYPLLRRKEIDHDPTVAPLSRRLFRAFGLWVTCSDDHMGEYVPYGWEAGEEGYDFAKDERDRAEFSETLKRVLAGSIPIPDYWHRRRKSAGLR
jgi:alpha-galactosidase